MKFSVITLFPEMFSGAFEHSIIGRAIKEKKVEINLVNLRDFGEGPHKIVDDRPYGGGVGMVLKVNILYRAIEKTRTGEGIEKVAIMDARGETFVQKSAERFSEIDHLILVCARYEGFDERIKDYIDYSISIGDFILTGGEIPAMAIIDSITRLLPGVLSKNDAISLESFAENGRGRILEYPQYTRPEIFKGKKVPEVLLSGHADRINEFRNKKALEYTKKLRPDLISPKNAE